MEEAMMPYLFRRKVVRLVTLRIVISNGRVVSQSRDEALRIDSVVLLVVCDMRVRVLMRVVGRVDRRSGSLLLAFGFENVLVDFFDFDIGLDSDL
jgi:hypothetical protein